MASVALHPNGLIYFDADGEATILDVDLHHMSTTLGADALGRHRIEVTVTFSVETAETHREYLAHPH